MGVDEADGLYLDDRTALGGCSLPYGSDSRDGNHFKLILDGSS